MSGQRIVLVDDSDFFLTVLSKELQDAGYQVKTAKDLAQLDASSDELVQADLVLLDVQMPEAFGDDVGSVFKHVRALKAPIYLCSSLPAEELARRAAEASLEGFIPKQLGAKGILARVQEILAR
jgi:CheY-like chemotaxis protein